MSMVPLRKTRILETTEPKLMQCWNKNNWKECWVAEAKKFISFNTRKNRELNLTEYYNLVYEYKNDCLIAGVKYKKNYYNDADIKPVEELFFSITIVPLGTFSPDKMALK